MLGTIIALLFGLIGVALGGGVRAWETDRNRKKEADALLSALVAEVEAVTRLARHRQFMEAFLAHRAVAQHMIDEGRGAEPCGLFMIPLKQNYFATYEASLSKIGWLDPFHADRITRFYIFAKAVLENYDPNSPHQSGGNAFQVAAVVENDIQLLHTVTLLGEVVAGFRRLKAPANTPDPFALLDPPAAPAEL